MISFRITRATTRILLDVGGRERGRVFMKRIPSIPQIMTINRIALPRVTLTARTKDTDCLIMLGLLYVVKISVSSAHIHPPTHPPAEARTCNKSRMKALYLPRPPLRCARPSWQSDLCETLATSPFPLDIRAFDLSPFVSRPR